MAEKENLIEGIRFFQPNEKAPDFVKASVVVTPNDLIAWLKSKEAHKSQYKGKTQFRFQLKESKEGNFYMELDTWKPGAKKPQAAKNDYSDLPF